MIVRIAGLCIAWAFLAAPVSGQASSDSTALPNLFIECDFCDVSYQRREIDFMNHVRDQADADVFILITSQFTASRGRAYRLAFEGQNEFAGIAQNLSHTSQQSETDDERRAGLVQVIKMGLMPYLAQTDQVRQFEIDYAGMNTSRIGLGQDDPWNNWVFNVFVGGDASAEESQDRFGFDLGAGARRITEAFKFDADFDLDVSQQKFERDSGSIRSTSRSIDLDLDLIKSLDDHWSYGVISGYYQSIFRNTKAGFFASPAIEYNIYPWDESDRRQITFAYFASVRKVTYFDLTIFDKLGETFFSESVRVQFNFEQPWGEIFAQIEASHLFQDFSKNRVDMFAFMDIRITKGLTLFLSGGAELIHDQLFLRKGDATLEEVLLRQRRLRTDFEVSGRIGLRFTFGSIYNNVVNPRL